MAFGTAPETFKRLSVEAATNGFVAIQAGLSDKAGGGRLYDYASGSGSPHAYSIEKSSKAFTTQTPLLLKSTSQQSTIYFPLVPRWLGICSRLMPKATNYQS